MMLPWPPLGTRRWVRIGLWTVGGLAVVGTGVTLASLQTRVVSANSVPPPSSSPTVTTSALVVQTHSPASQPPPPPASPPTAPAAKQTKSAPPSPKSSPKPAPTKTAAPTPATPVPVADYPGVTWGVTINLSPFPNLFDDNRFHQVVAEQIDYLKQLHVQTVRFEYFEYDRPNNSRTAYVIDQLHQAHMKVVVVLEDYLNGPQSDEYTHGYTFAQTAIGILGAGNVDYYQLANEINGSALKPGFPGNQLSDYDPTKLNQTLDFVRGESEAIGKLDPHAQRIVTINSKATAIVQEAIKRGIQFEILGWNWFSDFGLNLTNPDGIDFAATMRSFGKPLWVTELSRRQGDSDGNEAAQAAFVDHAIPIAYKAGFRGIFPFLLVEDVTGCSSSNACDGLVQPVETNGAWSIDRPRQVFNDFAAIVAANR